MGEAEKERGEGLHGGKGAQNRLRPAVWWREEAHRIWGKLCVVYAGRDLRDHPVETPRGELYIICKNLGARFFLSQNVNELREMQVLDAHVLNCSSQTQKVLV